MTEFNDGCAVSVVVPVYNCHEFLKECLDSLRNQSFGNIEIIVVDDGSGRRFGYYSAGFLQTPTAVSLFYVSPTLESVRHATGVWKQPQANGLYLWMPTTYSFRTPYGRCLMLRQLPEPTWFSEK